MIKYLPNKSFKFQLCALLIVLNTEILATSAGENCLIIPHVNEECCSVPDLVDRAIIEACIIEVTAKAGDVVFMKECMMSVCILNKVGLLENGRVSKTKVNAVSPILLKSMPAWIPIAQSISNKCVDDVERNLEDLKNQLRAEPINFNDNGQCDPQSALWNTCTAAEMIKSCPEAFWKSTPVCEDWRAKVKACPMMKT